MKILRVMATLTLASLLASSLDVLAPAPAAATNITIVVNGQIMAFDQPPIERAGRVFVPLRGVFERLGASVVYSNGIINATGNGRNIQLQIGSTEALVNGQSTRLDVAPFVVGARTLVPLRFISESLGANVQWDNSTSTVTVALAGQAPPPPASDTVRLTNLNPPRNGSVQSNRPTVSGRFSEAVDPNSVHITLDGRDVSNTSYVSANDFLFTPGFDLPASQHTVQVTGKSEAGVSFNRSWSFGSGGSTIANYLNNLRPANNSTVGGQFTVSGTTMPNSSVHIAATGSGLVGGIFPIQAGTYVADLTADGNGNFSQQVNVSTVSGGVVVVRITTTAPVTGASATATLNLRS